MSRLTQDLMQSARSLARTPAFSVVVVLTLGLGIGGNAAIFSVVNGVLFRPLPVADPGRLAVVWESGIRDGGYMFASPPNYQDWRLENRAFDDMGAFSPHDFLLELEREALHVYGARVTASLFPVLGVAPVAGRSFTEDDDRPGADRVAMISHCLWRARFGEDPAVVGATIRLEDGPYTLIGVMPPDFHFPPPIDLEGRSFPRTNDVWTPLALDPATQNRGAHFLTVIGRLSSGATLESAESEMRGIAARLAQTYPESNAAYSSVRVVPFEHMVIGDLRLALLVLLAAVGIVLLIACVNVANLVLTRSATRQKEYAIRAALGAGRLRIIRHALLESQLLGLAGGVTGLLLAAAAVHTILRVAPANIPRLEEVRVDYVVVAYTFAIATLTGAAFGMLPVLRAFSENIAELLRSGGRIAGDGWRDSRLRAGFVVAQVALSLVLLVGAGLLFNTFLALRAIDTGLRAERVLTMRMNLATMRYPETARVIATYRDLEERITAVPGVDAAAFSLDLPLASDYQGTRVTIEGEPSTAEGDEPIGHFSVTTPDYFETMGIPLVSGRAFRAEDTADSTPVILVNTTFVRLYLGGRDPIGRRMRFQSETRTIVGVVGDVRLETLTDEPTPTMYVPHTQYGERAMSLVVRTALDPAALVTRVREAIRAVDRAVPVYDVKAMAQVRTDAMAQPRFSAFMLLLFSAVALSLAAIGIYGVISFMVTRQTREIGVRLALGATPTVELLRVIARGTRLLAAGIAIGLAGAIAAGRMMGSLLYETRPIDLATLIGTTLFLACVGLLACVAPALRASRVDPMEALRYE